MKMLTLTRLSTEEDMTIDEFLHEIQAQILNKERSYLGKLLQPEKLFPWLQSKSVLSVDDCEFIRSKETTSMKVGALIDILIKAGPNGLNQLIKAIKKDSKSQDFIAERLKKQYDQLKNDAENQRKLQLIEQRNTRTPPPPYPGDEHLQPGQPAQPQYSTIKTPVKSLDIHPPPREPVVSEWPPHSSASGLDHEDTDSSLGTLMFEHENFHSEEMRSSGLSVATPQSYPSYISDQEEKMSRYVNNGSHTSDNHLSVNGRKVRAFSDPVPPRRYTSSNDPNAKSSLLPSVVDDQDVKISKCRANMQKLAERRPCSPIARSRSPDEHDVSSSLQSLTTNVKQLYGPPDAGSVPSSSGIDHASASPARLNLPGNSSRPLFTPVSPTSDGSSIAIYRPPNNESFEISGGSLCIPPTSY